MVQVKFSFFAFILTIQRYVVYASGHANQLQFTLKLENNKEFDKELCLVKSFEVVTGNIADCLEHCLEDCRCQSFQICENTKCQLCSSHKEENSSLLRDKDGCLYATYEQEKYVQDLNDECAVMNCPKKFNCCEQSGLCPEYKVCVPFNSPKQPWKRFTCKCPDGYHGDNCSQPIRSCQAYSGGSPTSGKYKVVDYDSSVYEVYCHFERDGAMTLVQSYSFANSSEGSQFRNPLNKSMPISENHLSWSGYRLSKPRMKSIKNDTSFLLFTCDYEKSGEVKKSDYLQFPFQNIRRNSIDEEHLDFLEVGVNTYFGYQNGHGKFRDYDLSKCLSNVHQKTDQGLHAHVLTFGNECKVGELSCGYNIDYFGNYLAINDCIRQYHSCTQHANSTSQLWFGASTP